MPHASSSQNSAGDCASGRLKVRYSAGWIGYHGSHKEVLVNDGRSERNHNQELNQASQGLSRRNFVFRTGMSVLAPAILTSKLRAQSGSEEVIAKTVYGRVRGARKEGVLVF